MARTHWKEFTDVIRKLGRIDDVIREHGGIKIDELEGMGHVIHKVYDLGEKTEKMQEEIDNLRAQLDACKAKQNMIQQAAAERANYLAIYTMYAPTAAAAYIPQNDTRSEQGQ